MKTTTPWPLLGGLRFVLASIVVFEHFRWLLPLPALRVVPALGSFAAVLAFFAISGYSIAASYERAPQGFYRRRFRRIYPTYLVALAVALMPHLLRNDAAFFVGGQVFERPTLPQALCHILMLQGFAVPIIDAAGPAWSLSIECACYLLAPLFWRFRWLALAALPSFAFFVVARGPLHLPYYAHMPYGVAFAALLWAWLAGFVFYRYRAEAWAAWALVSLGSVALALNRSDAPRLAPFTLVASYGALIAAPALPLPPRLARVLTVLGDVSYPLYLLHIPVLLLLYASSNR